MKTPVLLAAAVLVAALGTLVGQADAELLGPDEMREAGISLAMARTGDVVTPRLNGAPFLQKPPLFHALAAGCFAATGSTSRFVARLPAALCGLATLAATFALARRLGGERLGALAVLVLATTAGFLSASHRAVTDNAIPPFVTLAFLALERARQGGGGEAVGAGRRERRAWGIAATYLGLGAALGLAFLAKGAIGPAVVGVGAVAYLGWQREVRAALRPALALTVVAFAAVAGAWLALLYAQGGGAAVAEVLVDNNLRRALGAPPHANPWWYYAGRLPEATLPWTPLALVGAAAPFLGSRSPLPQARQLRLPAAWLLGGLVLLSVASAKRNIYLLPLLPAAAILAARVAEVVFFEAPPRPVARWGAAALLAIACLGLAGGAAADAVLRRGDLPLALGGLGAAIACGAWLARDRFRVRGEVAAALAFGLVALAFVFGMRARTDQENRRGGYEAIAAALRIAGPEAAVVLLTPGEGLRGAASFYLDREVAEVHDPASLPEARREAGARPLLVVTEASFEALVAVLGPGRVVERRRVGRRDLAVVLYAAGSSGPRAP